MALFSDEVFCYSISMIHKNTFSLLLSFLIFSSGASFAAPHALEPEIKGKNHYPIIQHIVQQKPVYYAIKNEGNTVEYNFPAMLSEWFKYSLQKVQERNSQEFDSIINILKFGAQESSYIHNQENKVFIFELLNEPWRYCGRGAVACFISSYNTIYLPIKNAEPKNKRIILHEIGHAFLQKDLYDGAEKPINGYYGSGKQDSIMQDADYFTCDDADGILNAVWLAAKKNNPNQPDLEFVSFCDPARKFKNARMLNRAPVTIDHRGTRTYFTYHADGTPKYITTLRPVNPNTLFIQTTEEKVDTLAYVQNTPISTAAETDNYTVVDFVTKEIVKTHKANANFEEKFIFPIAQSNAMTLTVHLNADVPAHIALTEKNGRLVYSWTYLNNGYNMVYNYCLGTDEQDVLFVYNRQKPEELAAYKAKAPNKAYSTSEEAQEILHSWLPRLELEGKVSFPRWGGGWDWLDAFVPRKEYVEGAAAWEKWLEENFPPLIMQESKMKQRMEKEIKEKMREREIREMQQEITKLHKQSAINK